MTPKGISKPFYVSIRINVNKDSNPPTLYVKFRYARFDVHKIFRPKLYMFYALAEYLDNERLNTLFQNMQGSANGRYMVQ